MSACTLASTPRCSLDAKSADEPAVVERVVTLSELVGGAHHRLHEPPGIRIHDRQRLLDQRQEVLASATGRP